MRELVKVMIDGLEFKFDPETQYEKNGNVYCKKCGSLVNGKVVDFLDRKIITKSKCQCEIEEEKREKERRRSLNIRMLKDSCFSSIMQHTYTFDNYSGEQTKELKIAKNYVKEYDEMKKENVGLLFYGTVGSGKTYLSCAIANALIEERQISVKIRNFAEIINDLQKGFSIDKNEYINSIVNTELLILDDLGIERDTSYAKEQVYNIINSRYLKHKPTIITTNLPYENITGGYESVEYQRIYSRILEMCLPVMVVGNDFRKVIQKDKLNRMRNKLLGGDAR